MRYTQQAKIIKPHQLTALRYPLPKSWKKAAGILKGREVDALKYQKEIRSAWRKRLEKLEKLVRHHSSRYDYRLKHSDRIP